MPCFICKILGNSCWTLCLLPVTKVVGMGVTYLGWLPSVGGRGYWFQYRTSWTQLPFWRFVFGGCCCGLREGGGDHLGRLVTPFHFSCPWLNNDSHSKNFYRIHIPGSISNILRILIHLIFKSTLWGRPIIPKTGHTAGSGRAWIQTHLASRNFILSECLGGD